MRRFSLKKGSFIALVVVSLFVVAFSLFEYVETYATISNLSLSLENVRLIGDENDFSSLILNFTLTNPSQFFSIKVKSFSVRSFLNGEELQYVRRTLYYESDIPTSTDFRIIINFERLEEVDIRILEGSRDQNSWQWYFQINVRVNVLFKEAFLDLSMTGNGVNFTVLDGIN